MNVNFRSVNEVPFFQAGGAMPQDPGMEGGAPMPEEGGAPMPEEGGEAPQGAEDQLAGVAQQLVDMLMQQVGDPQAVAAILQMALEMVQGGGGEAPAPAPQGEPVYRMGGRLLRRI